MPFEAVIEAATLAPMQVIGLPSTDLLAPGARAEFTVFAVNESDLVLRDSMGAGARLDRLVVPRWTILGAEAIPASPYEPGRRSALGDGACPHCGWIGTR